MRGGERGPMRVLAPSRPMKAPHLWSAAAGLVKLGLSELHHGFSYGEVAVFVHFYAHNPIC